MAVDLRIEAHDLIGIGLTEQEVRAVLAAGSGEEQVRLLRRGRGRVLEDLHDKQQALDRLDYFIYQIRQNQRKKEGKEYG